MKLTTLKHKIFLAFLCMNLMVMILTKSENNAEPDAASKLKFPKLSQSLREHAPNISIRRTEFLSIVHYATYSLTRGELEQIFYFADSNHDDLLDHNEWDKFIMFYVQPFEACDKKGKNLLSKNDFKDCFSKDPKSKLIKFQKKYEKNPHEIIMSIVTSRKSGDINFSDYLFIRRALFGWQQCQSSSQYIAKSHFKCAFQLAIPQKYQLKVSYDIIYDTGMKVSNDIELSKLDFIAYLRILYSSYVFSIFGLPHNTPFLEKTQFLKAFNEDRIPNFFEENEINTFYNLISINPLHKATQLNFYSFCFFHQLNRLFYQYSNTRHLHLNKKELVKLLGDKLAPLGIVNAIDTSEIKLNPTLYKEASLFLQKKVPQESDFYYRFKQPEWFKHRSDVVPDFIPYPRYHMPLTNVTANTKGRELFFDIMVDVDKNHWNKYTYYKAFQLSNLFIAMTTDMRYIVSVPSVLNYLPQYYDIVSPPIDQNQRRTFAFYKSLPKESFIDLITFLEIENYRTKFRDTKISTISTVTETLLKIVMKDYGMSDMPDEIIDVAKTGYDNLKRRIYDSEKVMRILITVRSISAELKRTSETKKSSKLKDNKTVSRPYQMGNRRLKGSNLV